MARGLLRIPRPGSAEDDPKNVIDKALAAVGLKLDGQVELEEDFYLWPECEKAFDFWLRVQTQWVRIGEQGTAAGLNYGAIKVCMELTGIAETDRQELFGCVQVMEQATLQAWRDRAG